MTAVGGSRLVRRARARQALLRRSVVGLALVALAVPLVALLEFSVRFPLTGAWSPRAWAAVFSGNTSEYQSLGVLFEGLGNSLVMCVLTVAIMLMLLLPTMIWVQLRAPQLRRLVEIVCLLPLTIPAVVLVVGLGPVYRDGVTPLLGSATVWLSFAYVVLVLPFAYRSLDAGLRAIDVRTLSEAARSLGAGWVTIVLRVLVPNLRSAIVSACFISIAVVLGEFTLARILARTNLQTALFQINLSDGQIAAVMSLLSLGLTAVLLVVLDLAASRAPGSRRKDRP